MKCKSGYKRVRGRCVRKSYNPFKMWGGWVGAVLVFLFLNLGKAINLLRYYGEVNYIPSADLNALTCNIFFYNCSGEFAGLAPFIFYGFVILGFLIGWGINILWRKLVK